MGEARAASADATARVRAALGVAARIANPEDSLGIRARDRLEHLGELSPEGVELALSSHLEVGATDSELAAFVGAAVPSRRVAVVLSANVCTAPLRALALALASAPSILVKPSRRDPVLAELLAETVPGVSQVQSLEDALTRLAPGDELHAYGSDETLAAIAAKSQPYGVRMRGHGTGFGLATVEADDDPAEAAAALAASLVPFDGRGCLSPRLAFIDGGAARARAFAEELHRALGELGERVPRGPLAAAERAELALHRRALELVGAAWEGPHHMVSLDTAPESLAPAPAHRAIALVAASAANAVPLLAPWSRFVTCVGRRRPGALNRAVEAITPFARAAPLDAMQRPPFDGPVDRRPSLPQPTGTNTRSR